MPGGDGMARGAQPGRSAKDHVGEDETVDTRWGVSGLKTLYYYSRTKNWPLEPVSFQEKDIRFVTGSVTKENLGTRSELS